jgi:hypothetical protein
MKTAILGGEMIRPPKQTDVVPGLFCNWEPGTKPENTYLGHFDNPLGYTEQVLENPEWVSPDCPLANLVDDMSQAERQIYEAGIVTGDGKILLSHESFAASGNGTWFHQPRYIQRKAECSEIESQDIADICKTLEATRSMVDEFCRWARVKGAESCINYLRTFVDLSDEEPKIDALDSLNCQSIEGWEFSLTQAGPVARLDGTMSDETAFPNPSFIWNWEPPIPEKDGGAPAFDWHISRQFQINGVEIQEVPDPKDLEPDWILTQGESFKTLIEDIQQADSLETIEYLTRGIQKVENLTTTQGRVAHSYIRAARARLEPLTFSTQAKGLMNRIRNCPKTALGSLAKTIFNLTKTDRIKLTFGERKAVWATYRAAKSSM